MGTTLTQLFNLALSACGSDAAVSNPDEKTREAQLCRMWVGQVRDQVIATAPWPSIITRTHLIKHHERGSDAWSANDPSPGYQYAFVLPDDFIAPWYVHSFQSFVIEGAYLHSNDPRPILAYFRRERNPAKWDTNLTSVMIHYLAAHIARPLTGSQEVVNEQYQIALQIVENAQASVAEMLPQTPTESLPDWITARGYTTTAFPRFFYPFVHLNPVAA